MRSAHGLKSLSVNNSLMTVQKQARYETLYDMPGLPAGSVVMDGFQRTFYDEENKPIAQLTFHEEFLRRNPTWFRKLYQCGLCTEVSVHGYELKVVGSGQKVLIYRCQKHEHLALGESEEVYEQVTPKPEDDYSTEEDEQLCEICQELRDKGYQQKINCQHKNDNDASV